MTPVAGLRKAREEGIVEAGDSVVVVTGTGLKDTASAMRAGGEVDPIDPDMDDVIDRYPGA